MVALFSNVAANHDLGIFSGNTPQYLKIAEILDFDKDVMSKATGIAKDKIRADSRMSKDLKDRLTEIGNVIELVAEYFGGDAEKTTRWFRLPNPALGNISPRDMIRYGRYRKLISFITRSLQDNER